MRMSFRSETSRTGDLDFRCDILDVGIAHLDIGSSCVPFLTVDAAKRAAWRAPLRRARRAVDCALRRVEASNRVIDATLRFAAGRPLETSRRLQRLGDWMVDAQAHLSRVVRELHRSAECAALAPETASAAPALLVDTTARWLDAAVRLDAVSGRVVQTSALLADHARCRPAFFAAGAERPAVPALARRPHPAPPVLIRPQWFVTTTTAEAARSVSRGRAPPSR